MRQPTDYHHLSDAELDIIYGQAVSGVICDLPTQGNGPECSLHGKQLGHFAPDDWTRPQPIGAGNEDFNEALDAARGLFDGLSVEIVLLNASKSVVTVHRALRPDDKQTGADPRRSYSASWDHANERDLWVSVRRAVILCILALNEAPTAPIVHTPTSLRQP